MNTEYNYNLKPCPFCGGVAELSFRGREYNEIFKGYIVCKCTRCYGQGKGAFYMGPDIEIPLEKTKGGIVAIDAWNTRFKEDEE